MGNDEIGATGQTPVPANVEQAALKEHLFTGPDRVLNTLRGMTSYYQEQAGKDSRYFRQWEKLAKLAETQAGEFERRIGGWVDAVSTMRDHLESTGITGKSTAEIVNMLRQSRTPLETGAAKWWLEHVSGSEERRRRHEPVIDNHVHIGTDAMDWGLSNMEKVIATKGLEFALRELHVLSPGQKLENLWVDPNPTLLTQEISKDLRNKVGLTDVYKSGDFPWQPVNRGVIGKPPETPDDYSVSVWNGNPFADIYLTSSSIAATIDTNLQPPKPAVGLSPPAV